MKIYTIIGAYTHGAPLATFSDYHEMIKFIRRHSFSEAMIYETILNDWNEFNTVKCISRDVYRDAYNGFEHYTDKNYEN